MITWPVTHAHLTASWKWSSRIFSMRIAFNSFGSFTWDQWNHQKVNTGNRQVGPWRTQQRYGTLEPQEHRVKQQEGKMEISYRMDTFKFDDGDLGLGWKSSLCEKLGFHPAEDVSIYNKPICCSKNLNPKFRFSKPQLPAHTGREGHSFAHPFCCWGSLEDLPTGFPAAR